ncbi:MAG: YhcB family protein [Pseudohongiellaceae bacterium]
MVIWLVGILCFVIGLVAGALIFKQFLSDAAKVKNLTDELEELTETHNDYQQSVYSHFENTAHLINKLTITYREVFERLARDADILCPEDITKQLALTKQSSDLLGTNASGSLNEQMDDLFPPRDYAAKTSPDQKGGLAADYGLPKKEDTETH